MPVIIGEKCPYCSRFRSPLELIAMPGGAKICTPCTHRHEEALNAFSTGVFTGECSECGKSAEQLRSPSGRMAIHFENGLYKAMCLPCNAVYVTKRSDLYRGTEFGHALGM